MFDWPIDFNSISTNLRLFYVLSLGNYICLILSKEVSFLHINESDIPKINNFRIVLPF